MDAGWAEILDDSGRLRARGKVMLAFTGGVATQGEIRSLRFPPSVEHLEPGHYWVRFQPNPETHSIEVTAIGVGDHDVAIRWDDPDLPSSLVELGQS